MFGPRNGQWGGDVHTLGLSIRGCAASVALALLAATFAAHSPACTTTEDPTTAGLPTVSPTAASESARIATVELVPTATPIPTPEPTATSVPTPPPTATPEPPPSPLSAFANGLWLESESPELASAINGLAWFEDGLDAVETQAIEDLLYIAVESPTLAFSVVSLVWVRDGVDASEANALWWIENFADVDVATSVIALSWLQDSVSAQEVDTIEQISYLANEFPLVAASLVSLGWVEDGIDELDFQGIGWVRNMGNEEVAASVVALDWVRDSLDEVEVKIIEQLSYISHQNPDMAKSVAALEWVTDDIEEQEFQAIYWMHNWVLNMGESGVAASIVAMGWVQDGVSELEVGAIEQLSYIAYHDADVAESVVVLGWVQDDIDVVEAKALDWISNLGDTVIAASVVAMGWVQDGVSELEVSAIEQLSYIAYDGADIAESVVALVWVQDGIDVVEAEALDWISNLGDTVVAASVVAMGWVRDGTSELEVSAIEQLFYISYDQPDVASSLVALAWIADDIEYNEVEALDYVSNLAKLNGEAAQRIVQMSFLETVEPPDVSALRTLWRLAANEPQLLETMLSHPALQTGITDDFAPVVATLYGVARYNRELFPVLLDPANTHLEQRTITLPLAGEVVMVIIRTRSGAQRSIDLVEHAVRSAESFMQAPLPTNYVGLLYENAVPHDAAGVNSGTHLAIRPKYDVDDNSHESNFAGSIIAHEVAHYYWRGNADWVDEGASDFMTSISEERRVGSPVGTTNYPCPFTRTIYDLEALDPAVGDAEFTCNYALGERLFVDLYQTIGEKAFQAGFLDLFLASQEEDEADELEGTSVNIDRVREAFGPGDALVNEVIGRWYDGSVPYDLSRLDTSPVDPSLPSFNGRVNAATVAIGVNNAPTTEFSAATASGKVLLSLKFSYTVYSIMESLDVEVAEYYEDGLQFSRRTRPITAEARYIGATYYFWVGPQSGRWATGRYYVYLYADGHKIAQVEYTVVP